jgi:nitrate reductase beta subunit
MNIEGNTLYSYGVLGTIIAKLDARQDKSESVKKTLNDLRNVRIHIMYLQNTLEMCQHKLQKMELEDCRRDAAITSYQRKLRVQEKELNEIKEVLYDSI